MEINREVFSRTESLFGAKAMAKLRNSKVAVFGIGGVGSFATEAMVRGGIGSIAIIDKDVVSYSNINRQLIATTDTIGEYKVNVMKERILSINSKIDVEIFPIYYKSDNADEFDLTKYDYIIDAIDIVPSKLELISRAKNMNVPIISAMGAGNKIDPTKFTVGDIFETHVCPLARIMRQRLRKIGIDSLKVVYSTEQSIPPKTHKGIQEHGKQSKVVPGSVSFVPPVVGLIMAGEVIKDLTKDLIT